MLLSDQSRGFGSQVRAGALGNYIRHTTNGGSGWVSNQHAFVINAGDIVTHTALVIGVDITLGTTVTRGGSEVANVSDTFIGGYEKNSGYSPMMRCEFAGDSATWAEYYASGFGFPNTGTPENLIGETGNTLSVPNVGTTGDPIGTQYDNLATNIVGSTESNTVKTIEA